jgi:hypothetical protein
MKRKLVGAFAFTMSRKHVIRFNDLVKALAGLPAYRPNKRGPRSTFQLLARHAAEELGATLVKRSNRSLVRGVRQIDMTDEEAIEFSRSLREGCDAWERTRDLSKHPKTVRRGST